MTTKKNLTPEELKVYDKKLSEFEKYYSETHYEKGKNNANGMLKHSILDDLEKMNTDKDGNCECAMCGVTFKIADTHVNVCASCCDSAVGTADMDTDEAMVKEKLCSKCGGVGNFCNLIDGKSVCGLCQGGF